ncbi:MAG: alpha-galactosidase [Clostridia bacterium]|nr:alpha-galactosidase [Clostridia bacterium]
MERPCTAFAARVLEEAQWVCDYVRDHGFSYGDAPINPAIDCTAGIVSCDRMVGWVLYRLGWTDQPRVQGLCVSGPGLGDWCADHGFARIDSIDDLQPGDIVFTNPIPPANCPGHTFIHAGAAEDGLSYRYDCGKVERIRSTQPSLEPVTGFMYAYRPAEPKHFIEPGLSFLYDGVPFSELDKRVEKTDDAVIYTLPDGLVLTCEIRRYPDSRVVWWVNRWYNPTDHDSGLISELWDCDVTIPFEPDEPLSRRNRQSTWEHNTFRVFETKGANVTDDDNTAVDHRLWTGMNHEAHNLGGRSCYGTAPFFDVNRQDFGVLLGIGWTGAWRARFDRTEDACRIRSGLVHAKFRVRPGESLRTSSAAMLMYFRGQDEAHNRWRRFISEISPVGKDKGRHDQSPFSAIFWGGVPTGEMKKRWNEFFRLGFPFDTCWIDAGWYEPLREMGMTRQLQTWQSIGLWEVSKAYHPDGYRSLIDLLHEHGVGFMVWFEPERIRMSTSQWLKVLPFAGGSEESRLAALNEDEVCDAVIEKISSKIEELSLSVYRQDFNIVPEGSWCANDEPERSGITEIRYITNLYRFWDTLLERFPHLLIDNCASGGHRIDIETLSRSVPLWRDDYQCNWDCCPEANQIQNAGAAWWYPYSGIGYGPTLGDTYSWRSAYANGMCVRTWEHCDPEFSVGASGEPLDWAKRYFDEYQSIRHYFGKDYYQLMPLSRENTSWCASQYHDPQTQTGIILAFRRAACPFDRATFRLGGLRQYSRYKFTNRDTGETFTALGCELTKNGNAFVIPEKRQAVLWTYERI